MPHNREDQRNLFAARTAPVNQRERASAKREREQVERDRTRKEGTATQDDFVRGDSEFTPLELLLQKDRTRGRRNLGGEFLEGAKALNAGVGELISEAGDIKIGRTDSEGLLDTKIAGTGFLEGFAEAIKPGNVLEKLGFGDIEEDTNEILAKQDKPSTDSAISQIDAQRRQLESRKAKTEQVMDTLEGSTGDPAADFARQQVIEELEVELAQIEVGLLELQDQLGIQDRIFEISAENAGLADALDLAPLEEALGKEGGLGSSTYKAILELANNAALSEQQRNEGIDLVLSRQHFSEEIIKTVNDLVENRDDLDELITRFDEELLFDPAAFLNPSLNFNVTGENDSQRFLSDIFNTADGLIEVPVEIPEDHESFGVFDETVLIVMQSGVDDAQVTRNITDLAAIWGLEENDIYLALKEARELAVENKQIWDDVLDADSIIPGSRGSVAAIWQAGELIGFDPQLLEMASMSKALAALIEVKSQGKSGRKGEGTIAGIGGLTLDMYEDVMGEAWTPTRGMSWELQALLEYIRQFFQGDALKAVTFWRESGEWGGTESFPSG